MIGALCGAIALAGAAIVAAARARAQLGAARELADLDSLTGLLNQRSFHDLLAHEVARAHRYGRRLSLIIVDVDNFKLINDEIGASGGRHGAERGCGSGPRCGSMPRDIACRMAETSSRSSSRSPEWGATRNCLRDRVVLGVADPPLPEAPTLSVSAGVAELADGDSANDLFARADKDLYSNKDAQAEADRRG